MTLHNALRVVRLSALYDLIVTAGFTLDVTASIIFDGLGILHTNLGLPGSPDASDPFTIMFANLMGSLVTVWALFRILRPSVAAGLADVGARALFSLAMATALVQGASPLVLVMLVLEIVWAVAQGVSLFAARRSAPSIRRVPRGTSAAAEAS
jgi:hypothetical protein